MHIGQKPACENKGTGKGKHGQSRRITRLGNLAWAAAVRAGHREGEGEKGETVPPKHSRKILFDHSGNLGSCGAVLALCAKHTTGGSTTGSVRMYMYMYVCSCTYAVHDKLSCRVRLFCRVCVCVCVCVCVPRVGRLVLAVYAAGTLLGFWSLKHKGSQGSCTDGNASRRRVLGVAFLRSCSAFLTGTAVLGLSLFGSTGRRAPSQLSLSIHLPHPAT